LLQHGRTGNQKGRHQQQRDSANILQFARCTADAPAERDDQYCGIVQAMVEWHQTDGCNCPESQQFELSLPISVDQI
jgi:hypothetical protein